MSISLDLKYRPSNLDEVLGNKKPIKLLNSYLINQKLPKVMIFKGPPGSGKTSTAYAVTKTLICEGTEGTFICGQCDACQTIDRVLYREGKGIPSMGVFTFDMGERRDEEYLQEIAQTIKSTSLLGKRRVILIDELQRTNIKSQDTLLVPLEYVPENTYVIIMTSNIKSIAEAIRSRSTEINFSYPEHSEILKKAQEVAKEEGIRISKEDLSNICTISENNPRKVMKILDTMKSSLEAGMEYLQDDTDKNKKYIEYFTVIKQGLLPLLDFIEELNNKAVFLQGIKYFIKDSIKLRYRAVNGVKKEYREEVLAVLSQYTDSDLYNLLETLVKIDYINENDAEIYLMVLASNLNKLIKIEANKEEDISVSKHIREEEDVKAIKLNPITKDVLAVQMGRVKIDDI